MPLLLLLLLLLQMTLYPLLPQLQRPATRRPGAGEGAEKRRWRRGEDADAASDGGEGMRGSDNRRCHGGGRRRIEPMGGEGGGLGPWGGREED